MPSLPHPPIQFQTIDFLVEICTKTLQLKKTNLDFFAPNPRAYPKFRRLGGMARNVIISSYMEMLNHAVYRDWLHFLPTALYTREKTIWTLLGSNPGRLRGKRPLYPLLHGSRTYTFLPFHLQLTN